MTWMLNFISVELNWLRETKKRGKSKFQKYKIGENFNKEV